VGRQPAARGLRPEAFGVFGGFPAAAVELFEGLEDDNSKSFWTAHRDVYERDVKAPMEDLLAELAPEFGAGRLFRPYRDVRFSKDKAPYKTSAAATLGGTDYVALSADGLTAGAGMVHLAADQLARYRRAVDDPDAGQALEEVVAGIRAAGHECAPHEPLKTAPKGWAKDHPRIELLRARGFIAWHRWPPGPWLATPAAKDRIVAVLRASAPLRRWLADHVGETTLAPGRR